MSHPPSRIDPVDQALRRIYARLRAQGWRTAKTRKGTILYPPDPSRGVVVVHGTPSDSRAIRNFEADLRRAGYEPPAK